MFIISVIYIMFQSQTYLSGLAVFILKYLYTHIDKNKKLMKTEENKSKDPEQDQE